jgi:energy-coupling factor transporter ATP-binding protein EcfA2
MAFKKIDTTARPPRQWALVGHPGTGKSTLAARMEGPILAIDADHRFNEVVRLAQGEVYEISANPADHSDPARIAQLLTANMPGSGVRTVVIDSLTSIIAPLVTQAMLDNEAGMNKNRVAAFKSKALALRLLQDAVTRWGCNTLWIYHLRAGLDQNARQVENTSISTVELTRLRRSLNMQLRIVTDGPKRGIKVEWARRGRDGMTLWDETGCWRGMPERIEVAVYDGLSQADQDAIAKRTPKSFASPDAAIAWGFETGAFRDAVHAKNAYEKVKAEKQPKTAQQMWDCWVDNVTARQQLDLDLREIDPEWGDIPQEMGQGYE